MSIVNKEVRQSTITNYLNDIENLWDSYACKEGSKKAKMLMHSYLCGVYRHDQDPVVWIAVLRGSADELRNFIASCEAQN
jgi:hypothetical protein